MDQLMRSLPAPLKSFVDQEIASGKYPDSTAFIVDLITTERKKRLVDKIESLVQEAHDSGDATPWTPADWDFIRGEVQKRLARGQGSSS